MYQTDVQNKTLQTIYKQFFLFSLTIALPELEIHTNNVKEIFLKINVQNPPNQSPEESSEKYSIMLTSEEM